MKRPDELRSSSEDRGLKAISVLATVLMVLGGLELVSAVANSDHGEALLGVAALFAGAVLYLLMRLVERQRH